MDVMTATTAMLVAQQVCPKAPPGADRAHQRDHRLRAVGRDRALRPRASSSRSARSSPAACSPCRTPPRSGVISVVVVFACAVSPTWSCPACSTASSARAASDATRSHDQPLEPSPVGVREHADVREWGRGRLLGILATAAVVVAALLLVGLGYAVYLAIAGLGDDASARPWCRHRRDRPLDRGPGHGRTATRSRPRRC